MRRKTHAPKEIRATIQELSVGTRLVQMQLWALLIEFD